jgi:hypothetical protein
MTLYRCGWCGYPADKDGVPLQKFDMADYSGECELVNGECCKADVLAYEENEYNLRMEQAEYEAWVNGDR